LTGGKLRAACRRSPVTANAKQTASRKVTVADEFTASIAAFADWMPYPSTRDERPKKAVTRGRYVTTARALADWARERGRTSFAEVTRADIRAYLESLRGRDGGEASQATKAAHWWAIRTLFRYLHEEEGCADLGKSIKVPSPKPPNVITHLDQADVARLVDACQGAREKAVITVFLDAGLRIAEAARLKVTDVCVDNLSARRLIVTGKGDKTRGVVIGMETASALRKYLRERSKSR